MFTSESNVLDTEKAFVSLSLFNTIKHPMAMLPITVSNLIQVFIIPMINLLANESFILNLKIGECCFD